ncbi:MAG: DUF1569 domain-containing protein [Planctomycetaceae bacterium]
MTIRTAKVSNRRSLKLNTLDEILADVEFLDQAPVYSLGNWTPGQNLRHLTVLMLGCLDGIEVQVPFLTRAAVSLIKKRILTRPMSPGLQLPRSASVLLPDETSWEDGVQQICSALKRMQVEPQRLAHPVLGELTREQWDQLHCRHCELHLSFLTHDPADSPSRR